MTLVVDGGLVVAAMVDNGPTGRWADRLLSSDDLAAPHLMPVEAANVLRRASRTGKVSPDIAAIAHSDLLSLRVALFPYEPYAARVWELRDSLTAYDAWYVALAESLGARLATPDRRLTRASGIRCAFATPSDC
jgi:predicted nucleic acid-binding protein